MKMNYKQNAIYRSTKWKNRMTNPYPINSNWHKSIAVCMNFLQLMTHEINTSRSQHPEQCKYRRAQLDLVLISKWYMEDWNPQDNITSPRYIDAQRKINEMKPHMTPHAQPLQGHGQISANFSASLE